MMALMLTTLGSMPNSGTPANVPEDVDCAIRALAWEYGKSLLPERGDFRTLFDAMQLSFCNLSTPAQMDEYRPPLLPTPTTGRLIYASANEGSDDAGDGSRAKPFATIAHAVAVATAGDGTRNATVLLRRGVYAIDAPIELTVAHNGLTIQNFEGEFVEVSGGVPFQLAARDWTPFKQSIRWETVAEVNNVFGQVPPGRDGDGIVYLGTKSSPAECEAVVRAHPNAQPFTACELPTASLALPPRSPQASLVLLVSSPRSMPLCRIGGSTGVCAQGRTTPRPSAASLPSSALVELIGHGRLSRRRTSPRDSSWSRTCGRRRWRTWRA